MDHVNAELVIAPMIETNEALANLDAIASVPGVDVLLIGPSDLSIELGVPLDYSCDTYLRGLDKIANAAAKHNIAAGTGLHPAGNGGQLLRLTEASATSPCPGPAGPRPASSRASPASSAEGRPGAPPQTLAGALPLHPTRGPCPLDPPIVFGLRREGACRAVTTAEQAPSLLRPRSWVPRASRPLVGPGRSPGGVWGEAPALPQHRDGGRLLWRSEGVMA
jgi:hypothetical protein